MRIKYISEIRIWCLWYLHTYKGVTELNGYLRNCSNYTNHCTWFDPQELVWLLQSHFNFHSADLKHAFDKMIKNSVLFNLLLTITSCGYPCLMGMHRVKYTSRLWFKSLRFLLAIANKSTHSYLLRVVVGCLKCWPQGSCSFVWVYPKQELS